MDHARPIVYAIAPAIVCSLAVNCAAYHDGRVLGVTRALVYREQARQHAGHRLALDPAVELEDEMSAQSAFPVDEVLREQRRNRVLPRCGLLRLLVMVWIDEAKQP